MSWGRGLFRLWLVASVLWLLGWSSAIYKEWPSKADSIWYVADNGTVQQGAPFTDLVTKAWGSGTLKNFNGYSIVLPDPGTPAATNYYTYPYSDLPTGAKLLPPEQSIPSVADAAYRKRLTEKVWVPLQIATIPPLVVLAIGWALLWALRGFLP
jgi:hypothetical protein